MKLLLTRLDIPRLLGNSLLTICNISLREETTVSLLGHTSYRKTCLDLLQLGILVILKVRHFFLESFAFSGSLLLFALGLFDRLAKFRELFLARSHFGQELGIVVDQGMTTEPSEYLPTYLCGITVLNLLL